MCIGIEDMSTAYFIVLDDDQPDFDAFVDGKMLTKHLDAVNVVAKNLGLKIFEDYAFQDLSEFGGPDMELEWFDAVEGTNWASAIIRHLRKDAESLPDAEAVIEDLEDYVRVFEEASKRSLKWHLELDF